jgi:D12 class N6 adenine-specific DNA methyltransferase
MAALLSQQLPRLSIPLGQGVLGGVAMVDKLKAPFPWFGGKKAVAAEVWSRLGSCDNYIEPFAGSLAVLLLRPHLSKIETVNDLDSYVANFWRATQQAPDQVAEYADGPVNEVDLHARHRWLLLSDDAKTFRKRMRTEPDYFDAKVAGWWCWGLCCWIGSGWCSEPELRTDGTPPEKMPLLEGKGIHPATGQDNRKPRIDGGSGQYGHGVHAKGQLPKLSSGDGVPSTPSPELSQALPLIGDLPRGGHRGADEESHKRPKLSGSAPGSVNNGCGVHSAGPESVKNQSGLTQKRIQLNDEFHTGGKGVNSGGLNDGNRVQLADAFSRGRGVNSNDAAGTCDQRRDWLLDWFGRLRDRLRTVRVCCGDWTRVCTSESVTTRLGTTGVFLDPPYGAGAGRNAKLYSTDSLTVAADVCRWCLEWGAKPGMRIVLAGYEGEGHELLEKEGWGVTYWKASGGYGSRSAKGKTNAKKERLWHSPGCLNPQPDLFAAVDA